MVIDDEDDCLDDLPLFQPSNKTGLTVEIVDGVARYLKAETDQTMRQPADTAEQVDRCDVCGLLGGARHSGACARPLSNTHAGAPAAGLLAGWRKAWPTTNALKEATTSLR